LIFLTEKKEYDLVAILDLLNYKKKAYDLVEYDDFMERKIQELTV